MLVSQQHRGAGHYDLPRSEPLPLPTAYPSGGQGQGSPGEGGNSMVLFVWTLPPLEYRKTVTLQIGHNRDPDNFLQ